MGKCCCCYNVMCVQRSKNKCLANIENCKRRKPSFNAMELKTIGIEEWCNDKEK